MRCVECAYENPEDHRYCGSCGARLGPQAPGRCPECQRIAGPRDRFCMDCGASLPAIGGAAAGTRRGSPEAAAKEFEAAATLPPGARDSDELALGFGEDLAISSDVPTAAMRAPVQLKVVAGRGVDKGWIVPAEGGGIGRREDADIALSDDAYVSEDHARIFRTAEGVFVEDLGSVNGTFVKVSGKHVLKPGDEFKVGQSIFRLEK